jgi:predicted transposase/invertase (TIGR01784 family)
MFLFETGTKETLLRLLKITEHHLKKEDPQAKRLFIVWLNNFLSKHVRNKRLNLTIDPDTIHSIKESQSMFAKVLKEIEEESYEKGIEKGREEGIEKGIEKGREEEKNLFIKSLFKNGATIDWIAKVTGCSVGFLKKIKLSI